MAFQGWESVPERFTRAGTSKIDIGLDQQILIHLGNMVAQFGLLEVQCIKALERLIPCDCETGHVLLWELSFKQKLPMMKNLFMARFPDEAEAYINDLTTFLSQVEEKRNQFTHSLWLWRDDGPLVSATRYKVTAKTKGVRIQEEAFSGEALKAVAEQLASANFQLFVLISNLDERLQER